MKLNLLKKLDIVTTLIYIIVISYICVSITPKLLESKLPVSNKMYHYKIRVVDNAYIKNKEKIEQIKLPYVIDSSDIGKDGLYVNLDLSKNFDIENKSIGISIKYADFCLSYENKKFYSMDMYQNDILKDYGLNGYYIVDIPDDIDEKKITLKIKPKINSYYKYVIDTVDVGYRSDFFIHLLKNEYKYFFMLFVFLFMAIVSFFLAIFSSKNEYLSKKILNLSLFSLVALLYLSTSLKTISYLLSKYSIILYSMNHILYILVFYTLYNINEYIIPKKIKHIFFVYCHSMIILYIILYFAVILGFDDLYLLKQISLYIYFLFTIIISFYSAFSKYDVKRENYVSSFFMSSIILYRFFLYIINEIHFLTGFMISLILMFFIHELILIAKEYTNIFKENLNSQIYKKSLMIDALTSAYSRYALDDEIKNITKSNMDVTVIVADINNLKYINDNFGHIAGDISIILTGEYLKNIIPNSKVFRTGGDEYIVICYDLLNENFLKNIDRYIIKKENSGDFDIICSMGMCIYISSSETSLSDAMKTADKNMYSDKILLKSII